MNITVKHDPCYTLIDHDNQNRILEYARNILFEQRYEFVRGNENFKHCRLKQDDCFNLLKLSPLINLKSVASEPYASIFSAAPGSYYRAHKDGQTIRYALNYVLEVADEECITSWYADSVAEKYNHGYLNGFSRELVDFEKEQHTPLISTTFKKNQCILFNTDIYHDFDNRTSKNWRHILTLRWSEPDNIYWTDALKILANAS